MGNKNMALRLSLGVAAIVFLFGSTADAQISGKLVNPNVLLVIDSSGSMDWLVRHPDSASESWLEAQLECAAANDPTAGDARRTSWQQIQDVMLGEIPSDQFHCFLETPEIRPAIQASTIESEDVSTYIKEYTDVAHNHYRSVPCSDANWNTTYGQCVGPTIGVEYTITSTGHACKLIIDMEQNYFSATGTAPELCYNYHDKAISRPTNGILERYRTLARFGIMTYDNKPAPASLPADPPLVEEHDGLWNYGESRRWDCKQWYTGASVEGKACTWNAGARAANANAVGPMVPISGDLEASNRGIREVLNTAEPLYCSPMGALLDDVGYYFHNDPAMQPAATSVGSDIYFNCRPKVVIFISDGQPTPDFEFPQAYCDDNPPAAPDGTPSSDPYSCPWNSSLREVQELHDLIPLSDGVDPILLVVIGFNAGGRGDVDCAGTGTHTWDCIDLNWNSVCDPGEPYECNAPDSKCVQVGIPSTEAECLAGEYNDGMSTEDAFLTPRQFLNSLALAGWPLEWDDYLEAPWRSADLTFCADDANNCGGEIYDVPDEKGAVFVNSAGELSAILDLILSKITATVATRTEVVTTDQIQGNLEAGAIENAGGVAQYEFNSGFEVIGGKPWRGYLYRQGYSCVEDGTGGDPVDDTLGEFHEFLKNQGTRDIWTVNEDRLGLVNYGAPDTVKYGSDNILIRLSDLDDCDVGGPMPKALCGGKSDILDQVKTHLHGDVGSARDEHPLADIYNSTPAILGPPMERLPFASYNDYRSQEYTDAQTSNTVKRMNRPPYLYVGTGDSVLHSFKVWGTDGDVETWGFVPHTLLNTVWKQYPISWTLTENPVTHLIDDYVVDPLSDDNGIYQHYFGVDGSPVASDVRLWRDPDDATGEVDKWRSVVLGSFGKGAVGYYCLDVTNPSDTPRFRWEISERTAALGDGKAGNNDSSVFDDGSSFGMGVPLGKPALAYVYIDSPIPGGSGTNKLHEEAVAILPGGYKNDENGGPETSTGVYIVRVADGEVIRHLDPSNVDDICGGGDAQTAQLIGTPAVPVGSRSATVADEAFMGDDRGRLWRIGMSGDDPDTDWCLQMYFDTLITHHYPYKDCVYPGSTYAPGSNDCCSAKNTDPAAECTGMLNLFAIDDDWGVDACTGLPCDDADYPFPRIPIIRAPTIVQDRDRNNIIIFGTGQLDALETLNHNRIFSLTEKINYVVETGGGHANTEREPPEINWWIGEELVSAEMIDKTPVGDLRTQAQGMNDTIAWFDGASAPTIQGVFFNMGEKMLGRPVVFEDVAYFVTYIPAILDSGTLDGCESGGSRIWGVNFGPPATGPGTPWSSVTEYGRLSWDTSDPPDGIMNEINMPFRDYENVLLSGLKMVRRPSCSGEATFELVAQRAATQDEIAATPSGETPKQFTTVKMEVQSQRAGFTTVQINSWSLVFN